MNSASKRASQDSCVRDACLVLSAGIRVLSTSSATKRLVLAVYRTVNSRCDFKNIFSDNDLRDCGTIEWE